VAIEIGERGLEQRAIREHSDSTIGDAQPACYRSLSPDAAGGNGLKYGLRR
jgi:hypothetical protein